ncbi:MAG TPA: LytTR family DNA-binding domain-containing protein [Opitutaceae bacterium]|nr:LytTR family DNA-binding domain-containing protein [Opitutaceae bacterium]
MTMLRILIADDEPLARARLLALLPKDVSIEVVGEYATGTEAVEAIRRDKPDIAFLDMQMPGCDGLQVVAALAPEERPAIVFVTAHDKFAVDAFGVRAVDYVLKPFDRERLETALERAAEYVATRRAGAIGARIEGLLASAGAAQAHKPDRLAVKANGRYVFLKFDEVVWVEAADNYVVIHTTAGERLMPRETLSSIEGRLGPQQFSRVNRSAVVRIDQVKELQPSPQGDYTILLRNGTRIPLSRNLRGRFAKFFLEG